ncbi:MAG TPA: glyoxylate/hydroxypyruvate reductase A [Paucimonas sp.]|nr:glyoxylate/hydroxypyruvate reductase A [Paucimonas sp.]
MRILFYTASWTTESWLRNLEAVLPGAQVRVWQEGDNDPADYALVWKPPAAMLRGRRDLKAIFSLGAGVDAIVQLGDALPQGVPIVRLEDAGMAIQMAEYATYAVLRHFRRFDEYEALARAGRWQPLEPYDKGAFTVGILGLGVLGTRIAQALAHFGFPLRAWSRGGKDMPGVSCYAGKDEFDAFLHGTRVLICTLPMTPETSGILDRTNLSKLQRGAYVINVARGAHLVEEDLLALVREGHVAGATLDVFREEPLPPGHPFRAEPRIAITPHISALTLREESARQIADKIFAIERGEAVTGVVDRTKGY